MEHKITIHMKSIRKKLVLIVDREELFTDMYAKILTAKERNEEHIRLGNLIINISDILVAEFS